MSAFLSEIFASVQGEGPLVGCRQIFLRFAGCNLSCTYCDTPNEPYPLQCRIECTSGKRDFIFLPNPLTVFQTASAVKKLAHPLIHSISLTGGEPLLQTEFLCNALPFIKQEVKGIIYLETNGALPDELKRIIHLVDIISMDIKLPGISGLPPLWEEHKRFLYIASKKQVFVKIVVGRNTGILEINQAARLVAGVGDIPLIIQPVTYDNKRHSMGAEQLLEMQDHALSCLTDVRIIPQVHKMLDFI